jgi:hypothetical protein
MPPQAVIFAMEALNLTFCTRCPRKHKKYGSGILLKTIAICSIPSSLFGLNTDICAPLNVKIN